MADCFYHGDTGSGPCPDCTYNRKYNLDDGETRSTQDIAYDKKWAENEEAKAKGRSLPWPNITKPRKKTNAWGNYTG